MLDAQSFSASHQPNRVVTLTYNGRALPADVPFSVVAFLAIYFAVVGLFAVIYRDSGSIL